MAFLLEVCVDSPEGLATAVEGGADRIELCSALDVGGLTPSPGLIVQAANLMRDGGTPPVYAMIRPRLGNFAYSEAEIQSMEWDIGAVRQAGLAGIVFGANRANGQLDEKMLARLAKRAQGLGMTLHRCFDLVPDLDEAVECAVKIGFERILTSGRATKALDGLGDLRKTVEMADNRISIMPGSGINSQNVDKIIRAIPTISEVHSSCSAQSAVPDEHQFINGFDGAEIGKKLVELGFCGKCGWRSTSGEEVRRMKERLFYLHKDKN